MEELSKIKKQFDELMAKAEEIIKKNGGKSEDERWRAEKGGTYCFVSSAFKVLVDTEYGSDTDSRRWEAGNYFKTEEEAKKVAQHFNDYLILRADAKGFEAKGPHCCRFYVHWNCDIPEFNVSNDRSSRSGVIYFDTEEDAEASIKKHGDIWKRYLGVEE